MSKIRGFEPVAPEFRENYYSTIQEHATIKVKDGKWVGEAQLPQRGSKTSAGYDFFAPRDINILPSHKLIVWTDVAAYMQPGEVLQVYPRSSMGIKRGLMLSNTVGIIDSDYYGNEGNGGNIGLALLNTSGKTIQIKKGERFAQGIFTAFLEADNGNTDEERAGGMGSTGQ